MTCVCRSRDCVLSTKRAPATSFSRNSPSASKGLRGSVLYHARSLHLRRHFHRRRNLVSTRCHRPCLALRVSVLSRQPLGTQPPDGLAQSANPLRSEQAVCGLRDQLLRTRWSFACAYQLLRTRWSFACACETDGGDAVAIAPVWSRRLVPTASAPATAGHVSAGR